MGRRKPRDLKPPNISLSGRDRERRVIDEDFEGADLDAVTYCSLREQPITRFPAFGPALVELELGQCPELATLEGIERCTGITKLRLGYLSKLDLDTEFERLAELPELTSIRLDGMALPDSAVDLPSVIDLEMSNCAVDLVTIGAISTLRRLVLYGSEPWTLGDVDPLAQHVTSLELHGVGVMPSKIGVLAKLERLKIDRSRHLRKIPRDLGGLASLVELEIDAPIRTLDESICKCEKLEALELGRTSIDKLPAAIGNLARLRVLRLLGTKIKQLPESIGKLAALRELSLPFGVIAPESISQLCVEQYLGPDDVGARIPRRTPSTPAEDYLRFRDKDPLPDDFGDVVSLELDRTPDHGPVPQLANLRRLERAYLNVPDVQGAIEALANSPRLRSLSLKEVTSLPEAIGELETLTTLSLAGPLTSLPASIGKLTALESLYLSCPQLIDVPASIAELPALTSLTLVVDGHDLPDAFTRSRSLTSVSIRSEQPANLAALARLSRLESLSVAGPIQNLEGLLAALVATPLRTLELGKNAGRELPSTIRVLAKTLTSLDLRRTDMTQLPDSLRDCTELVRVTLPCPEFDASAVSYLPPIKWTKHKWSDQIRFDKSKRQ
jgi:Leucine-rich repeat (LRR) protein